MSRADLEAKLDVFLARRDLSEILNSDLGGQILGPAIGALREPARDNLSNIRLQEIINLLSNDLNAFFSDADALRRASNDLLESSLALNALPDNTEPTIQDIGQAPNPQTSPDLESTNTTTNTASEESWGVRIQWSEGGNERTFYFALLPAMASTMSMSGGLDVPGAMEGLCFRMIPNYASIHHPGFAPSFQNLGIKAVYCMMQGVFTGSDGPKTSPTRRNRTIPGNNRGNGSTNLVANQVEDFGLGTDWDDSASSPRAIRELVNSLDSFGDFTAFARPTFLEGRNVTVEINVARNNKASNENERLPQILKNTNRDFFLRDQSNGNLKFKARVRTMQICRRYFDKTFYNIQFEIVNFGLEATQPVEIEYTPIATDPQDFQLDPLNPEVAGITPQDLAQRAQNAQGRIRRLLLANGQGEIIEFRDRVGGSNRVLRTRRFYRPEGEENFQQITQAEQRDLLNNARSQTNRGASPINETQNIPKDELLFRLDSQANDTRAGATADINSLLQGGEINSQQLSELEERILLEEIPLSRPINRQDSFLTGSETITLQTGEPVEIRYIRLENGLTYVLARSPEILGNSNWVVTNSINSRGLSQFSQINAGASFEEWLNSR